MIHSDLRPFAPDARSTLKARTLLATLATALAVATPAAAQRSAIPSVPSSLTLAEAIDLARHYNPTLRQAQNDASGAAWGVRNAYAAFLPAFSVSGGMNYRGAGKQTFLTQEFNQTSSTIGSSYSLGLSMQLSGRTLMQPGLARAQRDAVEANITGSEINLESTVRQQYLAVLQAEAQVGLAQLQVTRNEEFLRLAQARFDVGQNTILDVRQAEVAKGQSDVALLQARQLVTVTKLQLFQTIGVPAPEDPAAVTLPDTFPVVQPAWKLSDILAEAVEVNPTLVALRARSSAARASERATKSTWLPSLSLSAGWSGFTQQYTNSDVLVSQARSSAQAAVLQCQYINDNLVNPGATSADCSTQQFTAADEAAIRQQNSVFPFSFTSQPFSMSVGISLPIFTQFSRPLQVAEASAAADDAAESVRAEELQVRTAVSQAYYALQAAYETIGIQERNRTAAGEQLRLAQERYRVGSGTFFELLDAQVAAQRAEADYINAVYAYHRSIATLEAAVGHPLR